MISLLSLPRLSLASSTQATIDPAIVTSDLALKDGHVAPFDGVLVNEKNYRFYRKETNRAALLDKQLNDLDFCATDTSQIDNTILYVGLGIISGLAAGYYLGHSR